MRATKWIPIVEAMPEINKVILLEFGGNEYLGPPHHKVVRPAYLTYNPTLDEYRWIIQEFESIHIIGLSSSHIWTELPPLFACEMVY